MLRMRAFRSCSTLALVACLAACSSGSSPVNPSSIPVDRFDVGAQAMKCEVSGFLLHEFRCVTESPHDARRGILVDRIRGGLYGRDDITLKVSSWLSTCGSPGERLSEVKTYLRPESSMVFSFPDAAAQMQPGSCLEIFLHDCRVNPNGKNALEVCFAVIDKPTLAPSPNVFVQGR